MKLISHRGNLTGPEPSKENTTEFIQAAIDEGYDVEVDVWLTPSYALRPSDEECPGLYLGHDNPEHPVNLSWLVHRRNRLWVHTKNFAAMDVLIGRGLRVFYHQSEKHTVIGNVRVIWSHDISEASARSIIPLISAYDVERNRNLDMKFYGVCSDYIEEFKP